MPHQATARVLEADLAGRLAKFFPQAIPVRIPIRLSRPNADTEADSANPATAHDPAHDPANDTVKRRGRVNPRNGTGGNIFLQETIIEFGTPHEVLFMVNRPLEFADRVFVESIDGSLRAEATVVAVQYHPERTAIAVRFLKQVPNWIVKS